MSGLSGSGVYEDSKKRGMISGQVGRYVRVGGLIAFIVLVFLYFAPDDSRVKVEQYVGGKCGATHDGLIHALVLMNRFADHIPHRQDSQPVPGAEITDPSVQTTRCTKSYSKNKPLIQYALMVDAGSTGSRIHVYRFNNCGAVPELEDEVFKMTEAKQGGSGLSSYKEDAEGAAKSLDVLLDVAMKNVPDKLKGCTPIAVKATAGLRKLGPELSDKILKAVRNRLENEYPFPLVSEEKGGVEVMEGTDEGVYAWITTNYLLGKIGGPDKTPTAAVFDLGGGSTQVVFEPTFKEAAGGGMPEKLQDGDHKYELSFGGRKFELYQHSYLGYGLMEARNNLNKLVIDGLHQQNKADSSWLKGEILNPCFQPGMSKEVEVELGEGHALGSTVKVIFKGPTEGAPAQCRALAEKTLKKEAECKLAPCAFNGVHQPSISKTFAREDIYLFSYFYDRTQPLGMPDSFTIKELEELAHKICDGPKNQNWDVFESIPEAMKELDGRPESCLDLNFMVALLHHGYEMPIDREVKIAKKIKGNELGWCLGASLPLLEAGSGWECKIQQVQ